MLTESESFHLRLVHIEDADDYFALIESNRKRLETFFAGLVSLTRDMDATKIHLAETISKQEKKEFFSFVLIDNVSKKIIGSLQLKSFDWRIPKAELGYFIDANFEGKGLTSYAVAQVLDFGFNELKLNKIFLRANSANTGSVRVAEKNGFEVEGLIRRDYKTTSGELVDLTYYGLLPENYFINTTTLKTK